METSLTVLSVSASNAGRLSSSSVRITPLYRMSSTVTRIRLTGVTIRFINTATMGNTTKSRIRLPIHHKIMSDLSFAQESSSRGFLAEEPAEESLHRRHPCLHGNTEALHRNGLTLCRSLSPGGSSDVVGDTLGEATHDDAGNVLNHASAELSSCAGELKILSDLDLRPASRRHHRRRDFHRRLALALLLGPGRVHHDSLVGLVALNNLCRTGKLHRYRPHLGCHAPLVHVPVDIGEFGTRHAGRYPRHVLHVLPYLLERRRNLELVLDNHRLLALLTTLGPQLGFTALSPTQRRRRDSPRMLYDIQHSRSSTWSRRDLPCDARNRPLLSYCRRDRSLPQSPASLLAHPWPTHQPLSVAPAPPAPPPQSRDERLYPDQGPLAPSPGPAHPWTTLGSPHSRAPTSPAGANPPDRCRPGPQRARAPRLPRRDGLGWLPQRVSAHRPQPI